MFSDEGQNSKFFVTNIFREGMINDKGIHCYSK